MEEHLAEHHATHCGEERSLTEGRGPGEPDPEEYEPPERGDPGDEPAAGPVPRGD